MSRRLVGVGEMGDAATEVDTGRLHISLVSSPLLRDAKLNTQDAEAVHLLICTDSWLDSEL
jgi:hypothetical protein